MLRKLYRFLFLGMSRLKIRQQLGLICVVGLLPALVVGGYLTANTRGLIMQQHEIQVEAENIRVRNILFNVTYSLSNLSDILAQDEQLKQLVAARYPTREEFHTASRKYQPLNDALANYTEIGELYVYVENETMQDYGVFRVLDEEDRNSGWYRVVENSVGQPVWLSAAVSDDGGNVAPRLVLVRRILLPDQSFAVLFLSVNNNYLNLLIDTGSLWSEINLDDGPVFFSNQEGAPDTELGVTMEEEAFQPILKTGEYAGKEALYMVASLKPPATASDLFFHIATVDPSAIPARQALTRACLLIVLLGCIPSIGMVFLLARAFSMRIQLLCREMHQVSRGNYEISQTVQHAGGNDEIVQLYRDLYQMIAEIKSRDREIYTQRLAQEKLVSFQRDMRLKLLAEQINPHFLFNTLETIRMKALADGSGDTAKAIKLLGQSMRHVLEADGSAVSLQTELDYTRSYLEIQKFRFADRICYSIRVDPSANAEEYRLLPLLIQPVVENATVHGLREKDANGFIQIEVVLVSPYLEIRVSDNGMGMEPGQLQELICRVQSPIKSEESGIGLHNVHQRIRLHYGEAYGIQIESAPDSGTTVTLRLPADPEKGD